MSETQTRLPVIAASAVMFLTSAFLLRAVQVTSIGMRSSARRAVTNTILRWR